MFCSAFWAPADPLCASDDPGPNRGRRCGHRSRRCAGKRRQAPAGSAVRIFITVDQARSTGMPESFPRQQVPRRVSSVQDYAGRRLPQLPLGVLCGGTCRVSAIVDAKYPSWVCETGAVMVREGDIR
jgi:hypothetical protein